MSAQYQHVRLVRNMSDPHYINVRMLHKMSVHQVLIGHILGSKGQDAIPFLNIRHKNCLCYKKTVLDRGHGSRVPFMPPLFISKAWRKKVFESTFL
jgi:hypothetical protein